MESSASLTIRPAGQMSCIRATVENPGSVTLDLFNESDDLYGAAISIDIDSLADILNWARMRNRRLEKLG